MPLAHTHTLATLQAAEAVSRLRRRVIRTATGYSLTDPSDHTGLEITVGTSHVVLLAVRRKAGATTVIRPVDAVVSSSSANRWQWLLLHVPAALVPAGLVWTDLYAGAPIEWARGGAAVALAPSAATMTILDAGVSTAAATYQSDPCCEAQPIAAGDAIVVVGARYGAADGAGQASIRVELCDE